MEMNVIYLIEQLKLDPLENDPNKAAYYEPYTFRCKKEDADIFVSQGRTFHKKIVGHCIAANCLNFVIQN